MLFATDTKPGVALRPLQQSDRTNIRLWIQQPDVTRYTVVVPDPDCTRLQFSVADADKYLRILMTEPGRRTFAILLDGRHVGNVGLKNIDDRSASAECFIEIGDRTSRRRGIATRAMHALLATCFEELGLREIRLGVIEFNIAAIRLYQSLGFEDAGTCGQHFADERYWDIVAMRLDGETWRNHRTIKQGAHRHRAEG